MPRRLLLLTILVGLAAPARGQESPPEPASTRLRWALQAEARLRPEWRDDADLDSRLDDDSRLGLMRLRVGLLLDAGDRWSLFVQAQDSRAAGEEASTASNERNLDLHQGYVRFTPGAGDGLLRVDAGRQEWAYGDERLLGAFGWNNVGRSFDGVRARVARGRHFLDVLGARVASRQSGGATSGSGLYGLYGRAAPREDAEHEGYLLVFRDGLEAAGELGSLDSSTVGALGARVKDRWGRFDLTAEAAVQAGRWRGDDLDAWAGAVQIGASFGERVILRPFAGFDFATGDEDPSDGRRQEFFNFFPTNHPHYGYADLQGWRNLRGPYAGVRLGAKRHTALVKGHRFLLEEEAGPWKDAGGEVLGFDPSGSSGSHVGAELDILYKLALEEDVWIEAGASRFEPGRFARRTRGADPSHWAYVMFTLALRS
ncbi:MAG TPA: alginate export family protein [Candidatus Polarisedimenticolia bacterium]|nr:alginate export family protein [Candidatus Polarisedimenticolia bacterium]